MKKFLQKPVTVIAAITLLITSVNNLFDYGFNGSLIIAVFVGYIGLTNNKRFLIWFAAFCMIVAFMSMPVVRVIGYTIALGIVVYSAMSYYRAQSKTKLTSLHYTKHTQLATATDDYQWQDYAVQRAFGNVHIDLTKTILPVGTSFLSVRHGVGKVTVVVPFEIGLRIQASTCIGSTAILDEPRKTMNESVMYEEGLHLQRVVLLHILSLTGEIEVIRQ
ncbi:cell wall-active antibiotics response protein LiaF [Caryophanon latum]|uniref:Cell wall-active antibiotics response LiaF-like C-terminal domain-containing protein n=1 Tax=Caryophanon latum TaxID=33977 RepID=A0A1C0YFP3_9BACL|nr:cell wall-active antibiotics response protein LiaF [Caryophanon latum]OCS85985.1 hypothetical protein A6K76_14720 [Caryophanon latum]